MTTVNETITPDHLVALLVGADDVFLTGSRAIAPSVTNKDVDIVVLVALRHYAKQSGGKYGDTDFLSLRCGKLNILLTANEDYARRMRIATSAAKEFHLTKKADRVQFFEAIKKAGAR